MKILKIVLGCMSGIGVILGGFVFAAASIGNRLIIDNVLWWILGVSFLISMFIPALNIKVKQK
jgi:hypothetical protein